MPQHHLTAPLASRTVVGALGAVFFLLAYGAILLSRQTHGVAAVWPPNPVAVVLLLRFSHRRETDGALLGAFFLALVAANLAGGSTPLAALSLPIINVIEVGGAVLIGRRYCSGAACVNRFADLLRFLLGAAVAIPICGAVLAAFAMNGLELSSFHEVGRTWFQANALGMAVLAPLGLAVRREDFTLLASRKMVLEATTVLGLVALTALVAFSQADRPLLFLLYPVLTLAAFRLGMAGAAAAIVLAAAIGLPLTALRYGPTTLVAVTPVERFGMIQSLFSIMALTVLPIAAALNERRHGAALLAAERERALRANQAKTRLMAHVNHEIGNALNAILGFGNLLQNGFAGPLTERQLECFGFLMDNAAHLRALANDLLDVARAEAGTVTFELESLDAAETIATVLELHAALAAKRSITLEADATAAAGRFVHADRLRLHQILSNLVSNAIKYGAQGERVIVSARPVDEHRLRIEVIDHGAGIPLDRQSELFEPFNRLGAEKSDVSGSGLGLSLAKQLTEAQGGAIGFESLPGAGTRFWVDFPQGPPPRSFADPPARTIETAA